MLKDDTVKLDLKPVGPATERPISIAIVAMGGQGGGVLTDWVVALGEEHGWVAQSTSVPGVAQRTGATIYYVEMMQMGEDGRYPILAQMPTPGDVDVVIASEYMEAGRSILRGIVTPDRTTLIASNHRALAITEKMAPGESVADSGAVTDAVHVAAHHEIIFDMNAVAVENGSVISAALFGALAASGALPFARETYHKVIRFGGKGVEASIATFDAAFDRALQPKLKPARPATGSATDIVLPEHLQNPRANALLQQIRTSLAPPAHAMTFLGLKKVVDFQDIRYGSEYIDLLIDLHQRDIVAGGEGQNFAFTVQAAKYLANAMVYDDMIRVARSKIRSARRERIRKELGVDAEKIIQTTEYMHPRMEEFVSALPVGLARWISRHQKLYAWADRRINKGRKVKTYSLRWFSILYLLGSLRFTRRMSLRYQAEMRHRDDWLAAASRTLTSNYALAVEILKFRRLIKGYSDTHERSLSKFDKVMRSTLQIADREDAAMWAGLLLTSAVKDSSHESLDGVVKTIETIR
ncbi:indolepyruvate oxidoreductase subunit beta family protein [Rhizobium sp. AG855]|uniref:indolepyruvate oxidoreductase subunit beta family protein n=1 Tax=Rhizobium sp. AG855 TaxID=2183898 RepID=UPI000FF6C485|nr:indolepyruvate oxidoreductase subunit beta family protein [Rhizobium sp. AG855]RKE79384.1 indolepyruvate ferredoxin oxidoreductase beta subunit [Rhizobium sp. AG855]